MYKKRLIKKSNQMKTITRFLTLFIICLTYGQQNNSTSNDLFQHWNLGIKAGGNISGLFGDIGDDKQVFYPHLHFGGVADRAINEEWAIALEPHISIVGRRQSAGRERITYFNIPVLAKYQLPNNFTLDGGLHLGIKVKEFREADNPMERYKTVTPGITLGTTYRFDKNWFTQLRFNYKISDVIRDDAGDTEGTSILVFQVSVGYTFGK